VLAASVAAMVIYAVVALLRMNFPFELEWIEGGSLTMARRALEGQPLYQAPSLAYIPFNYPPLYYWLGGALMGLMGEGFGPLRLLSFLSSIAAAALLFALVRDMTRERTAAWVAVGVFFATYRLSGAWLDIARTDSLHLAIVLGAMAALFGIRAPARSGAAAGALFVLAFLAKQAALVVALPVAAYLLLADRRRGLWFAGTLLAGMFATVGLLDRATTGWFRYYIFELAGHYSFDPALAGRFWLEDFLKPLSVCVLAGLWVLLFPPAVQARRGLAMACIGGLVLASWSVRSYPATYENVLMPACVAAAWMLGLGWDAVSERAAAAGGTRGTRLAWLASAAVLIQFSLLLYDPLRQLPPESDYAAGRTLLENIERVDGPVLMPCHNYLTERAGKGEHFHEMSYMAVVKSGNDTTATRLRGQLQAALAEQRWGWVILDTRDWLYEAVALTYEVRFDPFRSESDFWPVTGMRRRPEAVFVPRADSLRSG
jgi:4-amino-4-deoxy-L-arabinose transferase-like glycosyltransferase